MADMSVLEVICKLNKLRDRDLDHVKKTDPHLVSNALFYFGDWDCVIKNI